MGFRDGVEAFAPDDSFLRRIDRKRYVHGGVIGADVFKPRTDETTLTARRVQKPIFLIGGARTTDPLPVRR